MHTTNPPPSTEERTVPSRAEKKRFLGRNILRGLLFLLAIVGLYLIFRMVVGPEERAAFFATVSQHPWQVLAVYIGSEVFLGIIPPEVFMVWIRETGIPPSYALGVALLAVISYLAGYLNYAMGRMLRNHQALRRWKYVQKYLNLLQTWGGFLVVVASVTPLPFAAVALCAGAGGLPRRQYLLFSLLRFVRYGVYGAIIYQVA